MSLPSNPRQCALCAEPTTLSCILCKDTPSLTGGKEDNTYYCSRACQVLDRTAHKEACKRLLDRRSVYRSGDILVSLFLLYREKLYESTTVDIEEEDGKLFIYNGLSDPPAKETDVLVDFPSHLFEDIESKNAALTALACNNASAWMHDTIDYFLSDITTSINEATVIVENPDLEIVLVPVRGMNRSIHRVPHEIILLALPTNEQFVLNLAGAQHGHFEPVTHFDMFVEDHIGRFADGSWAYGGIQPFGRNKGALLTEIPTTLKEEYSINMCDSSSKVLRPACEEWLEQNGFTISSLLKLKQSNFDRSMTDLVTYVGLELDKWRAREEGKSAVPAAASLNIDNKACTLAKEKND